MPPFAIYVFLLNGLAAHTPTTQAASAYNQIDTQGIVTRSYPQYNALAHIVLSHIVSFELDSIVSDAIYEDANFSILLTSNTVVAGFVFFQWS